MGTGACWAELYLQPEDQMWVTLADVKDYFYNCAIPDELGEWFCLESISGEDAFRIHEDTGRGDGSWLLDSVSVSVMFRVLPMGWSWSFFFAQVMHTHLVQSALHIPLDCILQDRRPPPKFADADSI
eukprot:5092654-Karenia_brevis.AAC.1